MNTRASFVGILSHSNVQFPMRAPKLNTHLLLDLCKAPCSLCHRSSLCLLHNRFSIRLRPTNGTHLNLDRNELNWHQNIKLLCLFQSDLRLFRPVFMRIFTLQVMHVLIFIIDRFLVKNAFD